MTYTVLALSGSLRAQSANTGLVRMAQRLAPPELDVVHVDTLRALPFYDADLDVPEAVPDSVSQLRSQVDAAPALLLAAAEYNYGPSGVLKNALDWLSRPMGANALRGKAIAVVGSGGKGGGKKVQAYFADILPLFGNELVTEPEIALAMGTTYVSVDGTTTDASVEELMRARLANLLATIERRATA